MAELRTKISTPHYEITSFEIVGFDEDSDGTGIIQIRFEPSPATHSQISPDAITIPVVYQSSKDAREQFSALYDAVLRKT